MNGTEPIVEAFRDDFGQSAEARFELLAAVREYVADAGTFETLVTTKQALQPTDGDDRYTEAWRFLQKYLQVHVMPHVVHGYDVEGNKPADTQGAREVVIIEPAMVEFLDYDCINRLELPRARGRAHKLLEYLVTHWDNPHIDQEVLHVDPKAAALYAVAAPYAEFDTPAVTFGIESAPSSDIEDGPENDYLYERTIQMYGELTGVPEVHGEARLETSLKGQLWTFLLGACYDKQAWTRAVEYPNNSPGAINMSSGEFVSEVEWHEDAGTVRFEAAFNLPNQHLTARNGGR